MNIKEQINNIIKEAKFLEVSDIHFHPKEQKVSIYYRILGKLVYQNEIDLNNYNKILRYLKFITRLDVSINKKPQDGSFYLKDKDSKIFIRIATIPLIRSESLVIRLLTDQTNLNIENISFFKDDVKDMTKVILEQTGLFIFTGPTGSGKTTTIYSIMDYIAVNYNKKIITLENPVEIVNKNLLQVGIDEKLNITYSVSLKATLRQDPDIIMIGEIRDEETARNVFRAALTGHTVVSTMHTKDIYGVVERFLDFGFLQSEIESVLIGVSNQRLILDDKGEVKSVYSYEIEEGLYNVIRKIKKADNIEAKIKRAQKTISNKNTLKKEKTQNNKHSKEGYTDFSKKNAINNKQGSSKMIADYNTNKGKGNNSSKKYNTNKGNGSKKYDTKNNKYDKFNSKDMRYSKNNNHK